MRPVLPPIFCLLLTPYLQVLEYQQWSPPALVKKLKEVVGTAATHCRLVCLWILFSILNKICSPSTTPFLRIVLELLDPTMRQLCFYQLGTLDCALSRLLISASAACFGGLLLFACFFLCRLLQLRLEVYLSGPLSSPSAQSSAYVESGEFEGVEVDMLVASGVDDSGDVVDLPEDDGHLLHGLLHPVAVSQPVEVEDVLNIVVEGVVVASINLAESPTSPGAA